MAEPRTMLTMADAARIAQVDIRTIMRWIKAGTLKAVKRGNVTRIRWEDWQDFWDDA